MLSQIRQISDGNFNTVFVKNKEQKFNLDKEIHDLECWKQSRNHVYRKEERELLTHLDKLRQQQDYLHHLDEERGGYIRGSQTSAQRRHSVAGSLALPRHSSDFSPRGRGSSQELDSHTTPVPSGMQTPNGSLPPVQSLTNKTTLHRAEAHTNICLICQLPRWSHGHQPPGEAACCCEEQEGAKSFTRRFTMHEEHSTRHVAPPIQVGQRRHSLMMARLNDSHHEHKPHPPDRGHTGKSQQHSDDHVNNQDHVHIHRHVHNNVHMHHDHGHHHHGHMNHVNNHAGSTHGSHNSHFTDHHYHHGNGHHEIPHHGNGHHGNGHHGNANHLGNGHHGNVHGGTNNGHRGSAHGSDHHKHHHHGNHDASHTPSNSPRRYSRQSFTHYDPHISHYNPSHPTAHPSGHQYHAAARRLSTAGSVGTSFQDAHGDTRTRDHELHWDRHQVCKLKGMITDPHYKEQLETESGRTYPWSGQYPRNNATLEDIEGLKNCRYLRFSKLNLMNMKENPEEEVEVFEKESPPP